MHQNAIPVYDQAMWLYGIGGLVFGFIIGMALNAYLLQDVPKEKYTKDRGLRLKYGLLNWIIAILFMFIMIAIAKTKP